ncbi:MAG: hypothetical protein H0U56_01910, partial [Methylibium sp.]|nr:hypothetical protein [Methylibium sp.]
MITNEQLQAEPPKPSTAGALLFSLALVACGGGGNDDPAASAAGDASANAQEIAADSISALPPGYVKCAGEWTNTTCEFTGTALMAYGTPGRYTTKEVQGPFNCSTGNRVFGDPAPGVIKDCFIPAGSLAQGAIIDKLPSGYAKCAGEYENPICNFAGKLILAYGAPGRYVTAEVPGPFDCRQGNAVLGDPAYGVVKACFIPTAAPPPPPAPTPPPPAPTPPPPSPTPPPAASSARIAGIELGQSHLYPSGDSELVLVANKPALVRVMVTNANQQQAKPAGTLRVETASGALVQQLSLTAPTGNVPTAVPQVPSFSDPYSAVVPGNLVKPGLRLTTRLNNGSAGTTINPRVGAGYAMKLVAVPVQIGSTVGSVVSQVNPGTYLQGRLPVNVQQQTRAPYVSTRVRSMPTNESQWSSVFSTLLGELNDLRQLEQAPDNAFYYGFIPKRTFGLAGVGFVPGRAAVGFDIPSSPTVVLETMTHEIGHNLRLRHAPCGVSGDSQFPYPNARLGEPGRYIWGYDLSTKKFTDPRRTDRHDLMSYCNGDTFSDYNYRKMQVYLTPTDAVFRMASAAPMTAEAAVVSTEPQELLLISGQIESGKASFKPVKSLSGVVRAQQEGEYTLSIVTAQETIEHRFEASEIDHLPDLKYFSFTIAKPGPILSMTILKDGVELAQRQASASRPAAASTDERQQPAAGAQQPVQVSEQAGVLRLTWDHVKYPYLTVTHVGAKRSTLAQDLEG